ncbi:MAG: energy-coupling factor transporter transmembrane protein EcfT [Bifidobacteriaceae bacterium]|jgi:energy-coupling factor transporter transmembrane protein EcfT|nr:energy-coupling factor transporter transmembrane protein EcfT [Bifidobacteriaceae bacterium]
MAQAIADRLWRPIDTGNWIGNQRPGLIAVVSLELCLLGVLMPTWHWAFGVFVGFAVLAVASGIGRRYLSTIVKLLAIVGLLLFVLRALLTPGSKMFSVGPVTVSQEGFWRGVDFSLRVMVICAAVTFFFQRVTMTRVTLALERIGISPRASYVVLASFQSIIDLAKNATVVLDAQKARGIEAEKGLMNRVRAFFPVLAPVFLVALTQTEERAIALDARAFGTRKPKTTVLLERPASLATWVAVGLCSAGCLAAALGAVLRWI